MKVIVGLGNPGSKYAPTRHNTGFEVIDKLSYDYNINVSRLKHKAFIGEGIIKGEKVLLAKPQTFMNLSGESVRELLGFYKYPVADLIVVCDDISLPLGMVRVRPKGSDGGQKGLRNIIDRLGTSEFWRVRVGIGEKPGDWDLADYVLSRFGPDELPLFIQGVTKATEAIEIMIETGGEEAMNRMNETVRQKKAPEELRPDSE